jgi:membrane fusion protein, adhesin transport system
MLNLSPHRVIKKIEYQDSKSFNNFTEVNQTVVVKKLLVWSMVAGIFIAILPWTQNIQTKGELTSLQPDQRPQTIHSVIDGQIEAWYVNEGDFVRKGDTILFIREIKDEYFDPLLLERTQRQLTSKRSAMEFYQEKADALDQQIKALERNRKLKLEQGRNIVEQTKLRVESDSIDFVAVKVNYEIAMQQYERLERLFAEGINSLRDLEERKVRLQDMTARRISIENRLLASRNDYLNAVIQLQSIEAEFADKLSKAASDRFSALSTYYDTEATVAKMENQLTNYQIRTGFYYITAPQSGYITQAIRTGVGETLKSGEPLISIMPGQFQLAVALHIRPMDFPLVKTGQHVRLIFDGWPAIVFSGWPNVSYGTFGGIVFAVDNFTNDKGLYRILVIPDPEDQPWPNALRVGGGARGFALLKNVPIIYEIWRQINGFPPDFYGDDAIIYTDKSKSKDK